jgi:hypothetical protein
MAAVVSSLYGRKFTNTFCTAIVNKGCREMGENADALHTFYNSRLEKCTPMEYTLYVS